MISVAALAAALLVLTPVLLRLSGFAVTTLPASASEPRADTRV
jgi:hypothetical protein